MCIIVYKPIGKNVSDYILENCFNSNPDGASFGYYDRQKKILFKYRGLMNYKQFHKALKKVKDKVDFTNTAFVFHFRITTENGIKDTLTHGFELSKTDTKLEDVKNNVASNDLVFHNGIISICRPSITDKVNSDTTIFIKNVLSHLTTSQLVDDSFISTISNNSKFAIFRKNGKVELLNKSSFILDNGIYYSNTSYKEDYWWKNYNKKYDYTYLNNDNDLSLPCVKNPDKYDCSKCRYKNQCADYFFTSDKLK